MDGHSTKSGQSLWINLSIEVDGSKVTVQLFSFGTVHFFLFQDRPLSQAVHCQSFGPSTLAQDRLLLVVWTVRFNLPGLGPL